MTCAPVAQSIILEGSALKLPEYFEPKDAVAHAFNRLGAKQQCHQAQEYCRMVELHSLGDRILVMGPSNAGKSTLAIALSKKLNLPVVHLDQLRFLPNTDWVLRSDDAFETLHAQAVSGDRWIIEGNYSALLAPRLEKATGVILLDSPVMLRFLRYLKRTVSNPAGRAGHLAGAQDSLKWDMVQWILIKTRNSAEKYARVLEASGKPFVRCRTTRQLNEVYTAWDLQWPT